MALKKAIITYTNEFGEQVTRHLPINGVVFNYEQGTVKVIFSAYVSEEARAKGAPAQYVEALIDINGSNPQEAGLIEAVSDALWFKLSDTPFIADYSDVDENGKIVRTVKSLTDLNAQIVDVE